MIKALISILLAVEILTMSVDENDPFRNRTIVRVLAAYSSKCLVFNDQAGEFQYNPQVSFVACFRDFLKGYLSAPYIPDSSGRVERLLQMHRKEVSSIQAKLTTSREGIPEAEQNQLASEFLGKLDTLFPQVYNFTTDNPDKYLGLMGNGPAYLDRDFHKVRKVFGLKAVSELPPTYQYFLKRARQNTSQLDQDGVIQGIFDLIKTRNKVFVEVGGGSKQDNTYYLRTYKDWKGYLLNSGRYFLGKDKDNKQYLVDVMVSPGNALATFRENKVPRELDFLSVDIDGNDYWVTKELLKEYRPAVISVQMNSNFPADISATIKNCQPTFQWKFGKIFGVSARAIYDLATAYGYSYVFHHSCTDIFFVRSQLLPPEFRGMRLEDTFGVFPIHKLDLNQAEMSAKDIWQQGQEDCEILLPQNYTRELPQNYTREDIERHISEQVRRVVKEQVKAEGNERMSQQIKFNVEVRKELDKDRLRDAQVAKQMEELRGECEKVGQWSPGWVLLAGIVIGTLVNLAFSAVLRCCKRRQKGRSNQESSQVFEQTE